MSIFGRRRGDQAQGGNAVPVRPGQVDAAEIPAAVMSFCDQHRLLAIPPVYETVYTWLAGGHSALNLSFAAELARGALTQHIVMRLHDEHLASARAAQRITDIGAGLGREVEQITAAVDAGIKAGSNARAELTRLTEELESVPLPLFSQASEIREIGLRQLSANMSLRETLRLTRQRLVTMEADLARHMAEANTDHLTRLPNRRAIDARLADLFADPHDERRSACLIMVDIDHFKSINDTHGHDIGDSVIRLTADILRRAAGAEGYAARWGGEEFAVLFDQSGIAAAQRYAETVRRDLEAARWTRKRDGVPLGTVTASFGLARRRVEDTPASLAKRADAALYQAKSEGRNRCASAD